MVKDKSGEGGQTAVGLDPINEGVQPDVLQRGRSGMARQRSKSQDVRKCKFFWQGCNKGAASVGVLIAERWIDSVVNVVRVNERIMYVKLVIGTKIVNIVSIMLHKWV